jgi:hypothetical protein
MSFKKTATVDLISLSDGKFVGGALVFNKTANKTASFYQANASQIDIGSRLAEVAESYQISADPNDYIFEAVRAVSTDVPNQNGDSFPRDELLRFDHRLAKAVYQTFILKPHHINHKTSNPKTARGVVLDASYNDLSEPLPNCPSCNAHTAAVENRDATGISCLKCGTVVKDEFVELLLAIDTKKDPTFAKGVKTGSLDSLSMGCFTPGTQVQMSDATTKSIELIRPGDVVRTHTGDISVVSDISVRQYDGDIVSISIAGCPTLNLTPNHPIWVINQETGGGEWIHADHAMSGMLMLSPRPKPIEIAPMPDQHDMAVRAKTLIDGTLRLIKRTARAPYSGPVHNFEVDHTDHSYVAGGVAVHNCEASHTDCSICGHRARTVAQFCTHIRSGNKKKMFKTASGLRMSYEKCYGVVFTEISRVDQPADPTAKQKEIFMPITASLEQESDLFILQARVNKAAQLGDDKELELALQDVKDRHPQAYDALAAMKDKLTAIDGLLNGDGTGADGQSGEPQDASFADYVSDKSDADQSPMSEAQMGIEDTSGSPKPNMVAKKSMLETINNDLDLILKSKESTVGNNLFKFADSYQDLGVSVTPRGAMRVHTSNGTVFLVQPKTKLATKEAVKEMANEIITHIANEGLVETMLKYDGILSPRTANILEHHLEDHGERNDGDNGPSTDDADDDMADKRESPEKNSLEGLETDGPEREKKDLKDSVTDGAQPDFDEKALAMADSVLDNALSDGPDRKERSLSDSSLDDAERDHAESLGKAKKKAQLEMSCEKDACMMSSKKAGADCECPPACDCKCGCPCAKAAQATGMAPTPALPAPAAGAPMQMTASTKQYVSRLHRLYKARLGDVRKSAMDKLANVEKVAEKKVSDRFLRAAKLAAKRQALNLEHSPIKAAFADALIAQCDLDQDTVYPGMDTSTATHLIEAATRNGFDGFVESIVKRASEFMNMSEEALSAIEKDVENLNTIKVVASHATSLPRVASEAKSELLRKAAVEGNMVVAPAHAHEATSKDISEGGGRQNIRSALGTTKLQRTSSKLKK